jgi:hypothetical protein
MPINKLNDMELHCLGWSKIPSTLRQPSNLLHILFYGLLDMKHSYNAFMEQSPLFRSQFSLTKYIVPVPRMEHVVNVSCPKPEEQVHSRTNKKQTVYNLVFL